MKFSNGSSDKVGSRYSKEGTNFCVFAGVATSVELLFFDHRDSVEPSHIFNLSDDLNRTSYYWHIYIEAVLPGQLYGFRVNGNSDPKKGLIYYPEKILLDPYGLLIVQGENYSREAAKKSTPNIDKCLKSVVVNIDNYDWENDKRPRLPFAATVIYEVHVRGFTKNINSDLEEEKRGTFAGLIEKIPYLKELGITAVELMPIFQFDIEDAQEGLVNYWGYSPLSLFAIHKEYSSDHSLFGPLDEFRDMVKALHRENIEVILDVVYNHSAEDGNQGPIFSFKGFDNNVYYILSKDHFDYKNFTGCGNTLNGSHSVVRRMILDSLHFWVEKMHVDGFRFDLASILSRDQLGEPMLHPPTLWSIDTDPILANVKLIAEAWDAGGLYQVGHLAGHRWREWNGQFRDDVRRFIRGDQGMTSAFVSRIIGSPDIYGHQNVEPEKSINFITCHDGFTLYDLVSYNEKDNFLNKENNRDGTDANYACNHGIEGDTKDLKTVKLRKQQMKNMIAITLLSLGTPMLLMGDEIARTKKGNNNSYCQDNKISWFDWSLVDKNKDLFNFTQTLIRYRTNLKGGHYEDSKRKSLSDIIEKFNIKWHGVKVNKPDWSENSHSIALELTHPFYGKTWYFIFNEYSKDLNFEITKAPNGKWLVLIDTSKNIHQDIFNPKQKKIFIEKNYNVEAHSIVVLIG